MRSLLPIFKTVALILGLTIGYIAIEMTLLGRGVPPANVQTFDSFLAWRPDATRFYVTDTNPPQLIAIGRRGGLVVSGPAAYVFDEQGALTQWELETGEGGPVTKLLEGPRKVLDREDAQTWLEENA